MYQVFNAIFAIPVALAQTGTSNNAEEPSVFTYIVQKLPLWITALLVLMISLVIAFMVKKGVENRLATRIEEEHPEMLIISGRISFVTVSVIGITIALAIAGIDLTSMLAALAFGISFGLQDTISNFVAGLALLASRPFTIGDFINVNDKMGKVMEIRTRATYLKTIDGMRLIVPNAELYKSSVLSYTSNPMRRIKVAAYCRYGINLQEAIAICIKIIKQHSDVLLEPKPSVFVSDFADYYVELGIRFWVVKGTRWFKLKGKIFMEIQKALEDAGMDAPYPVTSLSLEEDMENAVVKTYQMDKEDLKELSALRAKYQQETDAARRALVSEQAVTAPVQSTSDQSGENFLKTTTPSAAPEWLKKASQGINEPEPHIPAPMGILATKSPDVEAKPAEATIEPSFPKPAVFEAAPSVIAQVQPSEQTAVASQPVPAPITPSQQLPVEPATESISIPTPETPPVPAPEETPTPESASVPIESIQTPVPANPTETTPQSLPTTGY